MRDLHGKIAVVTGAASGFGREIAKECASRGMRVVLADLDLVGAEQVGRELNTEWIACRSDVSKAADLNALAEKTIGRFGQAHLLVNNAGVMTAGGIWQAPAEYWDWLFAVNVKGVVHGIRAFVPVMLKQGVEAHVLNTASLAGLVSLLMLGAYTASKHAVVALSECLHHELVQTGAPIGVSVLCPAYVQTGIADAERHRPAELEADFANRDAAVEQDSSGDAIVAPVGGRCRARSYRRRRCRPVLYSVSGQIQDRCRMALTGHHVGSSADQPIGTAARMNGDRSQ